MGCLQRGERRLEEEVREEEHSCRLWASWNWLQSCEARIGTHTDRCAFVQLWKTVLEWNSKEPVVLVRSKSQRCFRSYSQEWPER